MVFCATSLGRNNFLQVPTGLFGGDVAWGIGTYTPVSEDYNNSTAYRQTVATTDTTYQRAPVSCWYTLGTGVVQSVASTEPSGSWLLRLRWTISDGLWNTLRIPNQCLSFCEGGRLTHSTLLAGSTQTEAQVTWSSAVAPEVASGMTLSYMVRQRAPRTYVPGPFVVDPEGWTLSFQGDPLSNPFTVPEPATHLVYVGRRHTHPTSLCAMDNIADRARQWIFAVSAVSFVPSSVGTNALRSQQLVNPSATWRQLTPWLAVGSFWLPTAAIVTGTEYVWPYPAEQAGTVWLLVAATALAAPPVGMPPANVFFVRVATNLDWNTVAASTVLGTVSLREGDRILLLDATGSPSEVREYPDGSLFPLPSSVLILVEEAAVAWLLQGPLRYTALLSGRMHTVGRQSNALAGLRDDAAGPSQHALVVLARRSDGLYAAAPRAVAGNLTNTSPVGWTWTYPLSLSDGVDRFAGESFTDGLLGAPLRSGTLGVVDYAGVRRRLGPRLLGDQRPAEYLRINFDMGEPVVLRAFAWALVADGSYPTLTVHGSNSDAFYVDQVVDIPPSQRISAGLYTSNSHTLQHQAELLWQLTFDRPGSMWTSEDVASGNVDVYFTSLASEPRYTRMNTRGDFLGEYTGFARHVFPTAPTTFTAYRYYALTISVGLLSGSTPLTVEIQEFQPLVEAPAPASQLSATLWPAAGVFTHRCVHGRGPMPTGAGLYTVTLSRRMPAGISGDLGYMEVWDSFKVRNAFLQGQAWSVSQFPNQGTSGPRRATAFLSEVLVPRTALLRSLNTAITTLPFVWCYVRHRALQSAGDQAAIVTRLVDPDRSVQTTLQPPAWTTHRDTLWFHLTVPSARIAGESRYVSLFASNSVPVLTTDTIRSALPEFCFVLPSGDVMDFQQYDDNVLLPNEVPQDEWAAISALFMVQFEEPPPKRLRADA